ncbi:MAG: radical SAM protein [bacterium]|nr:radical SAM protein [bacterium]
MTEGCSHGCLYPCYSLVMARRFGKINNYFAWIKPKIVGNAMALLNKELQLPKFKGKVETVFLSFATDCFMYKQPEMTKLTLQIIQKLNENNIISVTLTKGLIPRILADKKKYGANNEYGITLVSLDENFRKKFEPGAAPLLPRIKSLKYHHDQGSKTWVSIEPFMTPNIAKQDLNKLLNKIKFVDNIVFGKANYNPAVTEYLKSNPNYYRNCVKTVRQFCGSYGIQCHIKPGTI